MDRSELLPSTHRPERLFLLDLLAQNCRELPRGLDADAFFAVTPQNLYAFVHSQLLNLPGTPASWLERTAPHYRRNVLLMLKRSADLRRLEATLAADGIPYLVLKGPIVAATVYPDPATRTMLDLDLLIRESDLDRAISVLGQIGYEVPERFAGWQMNVGDSPPMIDMAFGSAPLELHTAIDSIPIGDPAFESAWARARRVATGHGMELPALDPAELFAHVVMHASRQHRFAGGLRTLLDVSLFLRSAESAKLDWQVLDEEWQRRRISPWIALTIELASVLLGSPVPEVYQGRHAPQEALAIATEQLMVTERDIVPGRLTEALSRRVPARTHSGVGPAVPKPKGLRARARLQWTRVRRLLHTFRNGGFWPPTVARSVDLNLKRDRLAALLESEHPSR